VFFGIVAPKNTPAPVVDILNRAFQSALSDPEVAQTLRSQGIVEAQDKTPQGLSAFISAEVPKWRDVIASAHVSID
jgi:tripartite-type tricarboxylate transporter receptor subunit TctC